ncbi:MAG: 2-oxoacid:acceptor oxidoreductase family protein, partial [Candidatus Zixiibacteriota bacterium]
ISDGPIDCPRIETIDFFVALTQEAYDKHVKDLSPKGVLVTDAHVRTCDAAGEKKVFSVPFMEIAERECARPAMVNIVALGFFAEMNDVIDKDSIRQSILGRIPKLSEEIYLKAFEAGLKAARQFGN